MDDLNKACYCENSDKKLTHEINCLTSEKYAQLIVIHIFHSIAKANLLIYKQ